MSRDGGYSNRQSAGGGEQKRSVDDSGKDDNDGDELDSSGGHATSGKVGTTSKQGLMGEEAKKRDSTEEKETLKWRMGEILAGNVGDMLVTCRQRVKKLPNLGRHATFC